MCSTIHVEACVNLSACNIEGVNNDCLTHGNLYNYGMCRALVVNCLAHGNLYNYGMCRALVVNCLAHGNLYN